MPKIITVQNAFGEDMTTAEVLAENTSNDVPQISVIIPVYNTQSHLQECLDCVAKQTFKDIEIICVNDGSTDDSLKILLDYAKNDKRMTVITQDNHYAGVARNAGISVAKGKYILFFDSDDFMDTDTLEKMYQKIEKYQADICVCNADFYDNDKKIFFNQLLYLENCPNTDFFNSSEIGENIYTFCTQVVWNKLVLRELLEKYNLRFQGLKSCNDTAFGYLIISLAKNFAIIDEKLVHYRQKHGNHISSTRGKSAIGIIKAFACVKKFLCEKQRNNLLPLLIESFKKHLRYEISCCSIKDYALFKSQTKEILREEFKLFADDFAAEFEKIKNPVIITLTSFPARIDTVYHTILSLKKQIRCDKIVLYLGEDKFANRQLPVSLINLIDDYFEIHWIKRDLCSYTKLIPALKEYPNAIIITADDDILYPAGWLKALLSSYVKHPKDIHCHRVHKITFKHGKLQPYSKWEQEITIPCARYGNFLTGVGGVLYPPQSLDKEVFNKALFMRLSPYADDIWFWAMAVKNGTKIRCIEKSQPKLRYTPATQEEGLLTVNNGLNRNDVQLNAVLKAYPKILHKILLENLLNLY